MIYNWTKHDITIQSVNGVIVNIPSSGIDARVRTTEYDGGRIRKEVGGVEYEFAMTQVTTHEIVGIEVKSGRIIELPKLSDDDIAIVSTMVKDQFPNDRRIVAPNTGETAVRSEGRILYVRSFVSTRVEG
jgi:hypothetical protein